MEMFIGIDNGLDGAAVAIGPLGHVIGDFVMPTMRRVHITKEKKVRTYREIDAAQLICALDNLTLGRRTAKLYFEECPHHSQSKAAMRGMGINAGKILGVIESHGYTAIRLLSKDWQPVILGKVPQGMTKAYAAAQAMAIWPEELWRHGKKTMHGGLIDAALIAEYGRRKSL
jgi:hypothetical protein